MPLLGDITLTAVQRVDQSTDAGFTDVPVLGLEGHAQQRSGRPSHRVAIAGVLTGDTALSDLANLQSLATSGEETTFAADIVTALDLQHVVVTHFIASETAGRPGVVGFALELAESPPLPPPAQLSGFGGLDDFGLGDLGFDTDVLGDLANVAGEVAGAIDGALDALEALDALTGLAGFDFGGLLDPVNDVTASLGAVGQRLGSATSSLSELFGS
ncbi:hypothetical protein FHX52_0793 [Humibacillus xanthopallidus]|uniref:Uncharacterized protein n=1 Tax=Humibacillus xanthopallidus TaxID=412689 RepID=A0A543PUD3_9MICO|nr:hypothetical protein [Humibacillus xanthopallidus]TQN47684.1 hypothetical protein FHX52_0793 [Humibacillus xanthopallidus]